MRPTPPQADARGCVLAVHDEPAALYWLERVLTAAGYAVATATDVLDAMYLVRDRRDLRVVVADWHLGEHDAGVLVHQVRTHRPGVAVLVVTAYPEKLANVRTRLPPDVPVLFAPLDEEAFRTMIHGLWERAGGASPQ